MDTLYSELFLKGAGICTTLQFWLMLYHESCIIFSFGIVIGNKPDWQWQKKQLAALYTLSTCDMQQLCAPKFKKCPPMRRILYCTIFRFSLSSWDLVWVIRNVQTQLRLPQPADLQPCTGPRQLKTLGIPYATHDGDRGNKDFKRAIRHYRTWRWSTRRKIKWNNCTDRLWNS